MRCEPLGVVLVAVAAAGCASEPGDGGEGGTNGQAAVLVSRFAEGWAADLFACPLTPDCFVEIGHLGEVTDEQRACADDLVASGRAGVIATHAVPGSYPVDVEQVIVLDGSGGMHRQERTRCQNARGCDGYYTTDWFRDPLERCPVAAWHGYPIEACAVLREPWTCDELGI